MDKAVFIGINKDKEYIVCTRDGTVFSGPFKTSEEAIRERARLGLDVVEDLGHITILPSTANGVSSYVICIDNIPHSRCRSRSDAEALVRAFETGGTALVYKRFFAGLGDLLALSGAAVMLSKMYGSLVLTSTDRYQDEFKRIFVNHPEIKLQKLLKDPRDLADASIEDNPLFYTDKVSIAETDMESFERVYKHFCIPYKYRWDACPVMEACKKVDQLQVPEEPYAFIHDDPKRGFCIDRKRVPSMRLYHAWDVITDSILSFKDVIENATEVHVFESSFFHLTECLSPKGSLYYHRYARHYQKRYCDYKTRNKWKILT